MTLELHMLIGPPGSGKSTLVNEVLRPKFPNAYIHSPDRFIEFIAESTGKTYKELWEKTYPKAMENVMQSLRRFTVEEPSPVIWDQTNLGFKKRLGVIKPLTHRGYVVTYHVFDQPEELLWERNRARVASGREIPDHVLKNMIESFTFSPAELVYVRQIHIYGDANRYAKIIEAAKPDVSQYGNTAHG